MKFDHEIRIVPAGTVAWQLEITINNKLIYFCDTFNSHRAAAAHAEYLLVEEHRKLDELEYQKEE